MRTEVDACPACVGIILDGNRRWARERGLPTLEGHRRGRENVERITFAARDLGIRHLVVYAFSTENWKRSEEEVSYLMRLFGDWAAGSAKRLAKERVAVRFVGQRERFSASLQEVMKTAEQDSPVFPTITLWICVSYGGRAEIVEAARSAASVYGTVTEDTLPRCLWTFGMPDPDIIIRTGGEQRISNFLLWQCAYAEFFFPKVYWPAFTKDDLVAILAEYGARDRRLGK